MDKNIKNKLKKIQKILKIVRNKKHFIYKYNNISLENGFELDYYCIKKTK
jgi:hypothetical protein